MLPIPGIEEILRMLISVFGDLLGPLLGFILDLLGAGLASP